MSTRRNKTKSEAERKRYRDAYFEQWVETRVFWASLV